MASQKQIEANRNNAKNSTGPRTKAGKARSRLNALRDGLTGQITTLSPKDRVLFENAKTEMIAGFDPRSPMERELAGAIAWDTWRLNHLRGIEMNVFALGLAEQEEEEDEHDHPDDFDTALSDARTFRSEAKRLELMSLYEQRLNRTMHRNLATLRDLQAERKRHYDRDRQEEIRVARLHEFNDMPIKASTRPSRNGFVFSDEEIATAAVRQRYLDTASCLMKTATPHQLYGNLIIGCGDSFLEKLDDQTPAALVAPEIRTIDRLNHPKDFGLRPAA